jgi:single-stranded DNA-binding protein
LQTRSYEDKDGIKRNVVDVIANEVEFLTPKGSQADGDEEMPIRKERPQLEALDDNELPF